MNTRNLLILALAPVLLSLACNKPKPAPEKPVVVAAQNPPKVENDEPDPEPYKGNVEERQMQTPDWVSSVAVAQPRMTVLNGSRFQVDLSQEVVEKIEASLIGTGRFQIAERSRLESVKQEIVANNDADWFNPANATKVGKFMGAKFLVLPTVSANIGPLTTTFELQVKVLETETATMVHNYTIRTASSSLNINSSIRTCIGAIQAKLEEALAADFPPRGVIIKVAGKGKDVLWIDTRQAAQIQPGMTLRILDVEQVYNPVSRTKSNFFTTAGQAIVLSVESSGITARLKKRYTDVSVGMMAEVKR